MDHEWGDWRKAQQDVLLKVFLDLGFIPEEAQKAVEEPCTAPGVTCGEIGQVVGLGFNVKLPGILSEAIGSLEWLQAIFLSNCGVHGFIPKELGRLQHLHVLYLDNNELSGTIPKELGLMTSLADLSLSSNQLEGEIPAELSQLSRLKRFSAEGNRLSGHIPPEFGKLQSLTTLVLSENQLVGQIPREIGELKNLELMSLSQNQLGGMIPRELGKLQMLGALYLPGNNLEGEIPNELCELKKLEHLVMSRNQLTGALSKDFGKLRNLTFLLLNQNQLTGSIPKELGELKSLRFLSLYQNQLNGTIPTELAELSNLENLQLYGNRLSGEIPPEFGRLQALKTLELYSNQLQGKLPRQLADLKKLVTLSLAQNRLEGNIPRALGQLKDLQKLELSQNHLTGPIPKELAELKFLASLHLNDNGLSGTIPAELGQLEHLHDLTLEQNHLTGKIPGVFGQLKKLQILRLDGNRLTGEIPHSIWQLPLQALHLDGNRLRGALPPVLHVKELTTLDVSGNSLSGELPQFSADRSFLQYLDLSQNLFVGPLAPGVQSLCDCCGKFLTRLRISHNKVTGPMPECLLQMKQLTHLALNNNQLDGFIPKISANNLVILTLHGNALTGSIPYSMQDLKQLAVLTLHENSLDGQISQELHLTGACIDNPSFRVRGAPCIAFRTFLESEDGAMPEPCEKVLPKYRYTGEDLEQILVNCPKLCNLCSTGSEGAARATFHHNRFSCQVPARISRTADIHGTVVMGNMVGHGHELNASWISAEEDQAFLYYSPEVWKAHVFLMCVVLVLALCASLCQKRLRSCFQQTLRSLSCGSTSRVAASNLALLRAAACAALLCGPLLLTFLAGTGYYMCAPPLSAITLANLREDPAAEFLVVVFWSALTLLFHSIVASMPAVSTRRPAQFSTASLRTGRQVLTRAAAWMLWIMLVSFFSLPSILFAVAQALPAHNALHLSEEILTYVHGAAPFLIVAIDMFLASPLSNIYSSLSGIKADRLLMTFRLFAAWLLSVLTTVFLHENCFGGWKWFWIVCEEDSPEHQTFNWRIWDEEILDTNKDMCQLRERWWVDGQCSRSIVEGLNALILKKLLIRCTVQPLVLLVLWHFSRLEPVAEETSAQMSGRHLRLFRGKGPKMTGSLFPLQQMALITTFMEILFFWSPLIPLLSIFVLCITAANLFLFDMGVWTFQVQMPTNAVNQQAALSRSYLTIALAASCGFQLWHAFGTRMCGRHVLLVLNLTLLLLPLPVKRWLLPLERARSFFWAEMEQATDAEVVEMAIHVDLRRWTAK